MPSIVQPNRQQVQKYSNNSFANIKNPFGGSNKFKNIQVPANFNKQPKIKLPVPGEGLPRVLHYCADQSGCAFWRMIWPGNELLAHNKAVIMTLYQMVTNGQFYGGLDAVRLQRQCTPPQLEFIKFLRKLTDDMKAQTGKGFRIIWEVDDIVCPAEDIPDYNVCKEAFEGPQVHATLKEMVKYIDEMTVVSPFMREHYRKHLNFDKITVIPNYAPKLWLDQGFDVDHIMNRINSREKPKVLYAGSGTHFDVANKTGQKDDFGHVVEAIIQDITIFKKYDWVFYGAIPMKLRPFINNGIEFHPWESITNYTRKLKELDVDFAIAPLKNNNFSRAKANIKLTEFGMQGTPCIAQNLECYNSDGWELLFDNSKEMFAIIDDLWNNKTSSYIEHCHKGREYAKDFLLENHLDEYTTLYTTPYGDEKRKAFDHFYKNNKDQFIT